jgi:hypothetical protein
MITKLPVWGGQGPYKDYRATDDDMRFLHAEELVIIIIIIIS